MTPLVYLCDTTPPGETQLEFWRRHAAERAKTITTLRLELAHERELLEAAYDLIARHHTPAEPCREDAVEEVQERYFERAETEVLHGS